MNKLDKRRLPGSDIEVSRIVLGTMTFGAQVDEQAAASMIDLALERGVTFIDTANVYNKGASEEMLGRLLAGRRARVVLATKVGNKTGDGADENGLGRRAIRRGLEESLRRLRTDFVDVYYFHQPDPHTPLEESLAEADALVREGKVRVIAVSNYAAWQICRLHWIAAERGWRAPVVVQPMGNLIARGIEPELLPLCRALGLATFVYNPLAGGLLTGKQLGDKPLAGTRFDGNQNYLDRYWNDASRAAVEELRRIAEAAGRSLVELSLAWSLHHSGADGLILGASRLDQLEQNLRALEAGPLPHDALEGADAVWRRLRGPTPQYNR